MFSRVLHPVFFSILLATAQGEGPPFYGVPPTWIGLRHFPFCKVVIPFPFPAKHGEPSQPVFDPVKLPLKRFSSPPFPFFPTLPDVLLFSKRSSSQLQNCGLFFFETFRWDSIGVCPLPLLGRFFCLVHGVFSSAPRSVNFPLF